MATAAEQVIDLIFGRWRSQILFAGIELGIFDRLDRTEPRTARELAADTGVERRCSIGCCGRRAQLAC